MKLLTNSNKVAALVVFVVVFGALAAACGQDAGGKVTDRPEAPTIRRSEAETPPAARGVAKVRQDDEAMLEAEEVDPEKLREIRVAVFPIDVLKDVGVSSEALTDQINVLLATLPKVTIVDRENIEKAADEHRMAMSGLVDMKTAVKLGKFLNAQYVVVGRGSKIGKSMYLVLKVIDVETTAQETVSAKAPAAEGMEKVLENLSWSLRKRIQKLQQPVVQPVDKTLQKLRELARPLAGKVFLVSVTDTHLNKPLRDPAGQMTVVNRLRSLGVDAIAPTEPPDVWRRALLEVGTYGEKKVDYLVEGEGVSAHAGEVHNMISCRARVELRLIAVPGKAVIVTDRGIAARVDVVEAFAAKAAIEDAGQQATDSVVTRLVRRLEEGG